VSSNLLTSWTYANDLKQSAKRSFEAEWEISHLMTLPHLRRIYEPKVGPVVNELAGNNGMIHENILPRRLIRTYRRI
jgi:hypothetical protein